MSFSLDNLKDPKLWLRAGYTLLSLIVLGYLWYWIFYLLLLIWGVQTGFWLYGGQSNEDGLAYTKFLAQALYQYVEYITYITDKKPYPLSYLP